MKDELATTHGETVKVLFPGMLNHHSGPDFLHAKVKINDVVLYGDVEVHIKSSDWYGHKHDKDPAYDKVILHVIWEDNKEVYLHDQALPALLLKNCIDDQFIERYERLIENKAGIPCEAHLPYVDKKHWTSAIKKAFMERLQRKYAYVDGQLKAYKHDSEKIAYELLAKAFGFNVNQESFFTLSQKVPLQVVKQQTNDLLSLEALFLGQAGFLTRSEAKTAYVKELVNVYTYLKHKYDLPQPLQQSQWKFFRLRPANFPPLRIAQFVRFLYKQPSIFYALMNTPYETLVKRLRLRTSPYWRMHYAIGKKSKAIIPKLGVESANTIIINTVVPLWVAYGRLRDEDTYLERTMDLLKKMPPEKNKITQTWKQFGMPIKDSLASQGSLGLYKNFCKYKRCLSCSIGRAILKNEPACDG